MDRITRSLLNEFSADAGLANLAEDKQFEHLAAFLSISRHLEESFDTSDVVLGSGGDTGIDAIGVIVNGALVTDSELVQEYADSNGHIDAAFIFVQAERSAAFDTSKVGQFGFGVTDFFNDSPSLPRNDAVKSAAEVMNAIYAKGSKFKRGNPVCKLYYVTTGKWMNDANLLARSKAVVGDLEHLGLFRDVDFVFVGADTVQRLYNQSRNSISREFTFADKIVVPEVPGVTESYIGLLPAEEFITLLDDGAGGILKTIFYDNVRDWQDYNEVNSEMRETLASDRLRARFALMNNGVTVIARTVRSTGNKMFVEDYQIVNGCQTSHVLFNERNSIDSSVHIPLRLIATQDEEVIAAIVKATNRQTAVKAEQLIALSDFQKKLEKFLQSFDPAQRLFYERRSRQYNATPNIEKTRIVTPQNLIRAYASIFLEEPHRTTRSYRGLLERVGKDIFGAEDRLEPYYCAASALYRIEFLFRNDSLDSKFKPARYQVLYAARLLQNPSRPPRSNSHDMAKYADAISAMLWKSDDAEVRFRQAADIVDKVAGGNFHRDSIRTQPFTERLKAACAKALAGKKT